MSSRRSASVSERFSFSRSKTHHPFGQLEARSKSKKERAASLEANIFDSESQTNGPNCRRTTLATQEHIMSR